MDELMEPARLMSHIALPEKLEEVVLRVGERIKREGDKHYASVNFQLDLLTELSQFELGRFLLQHRGINGYWTHYVLTWPQFGRTTGKNHHPASLTWLESFLLNRAPTFLATQQRFEIFLNENQTQVKNNTKLASVPCGMMGELLYLNYRGIDHIDLLGIDYDADIFNEAMSLAEKQSLAPFVKFVQKDAWHLGAQDEFDLISSNGLNIYEPNHDKVTALYRQFYEALKPHGKLVMSTLTWPPSSDEHCEWDMTKVNQDDLLLQKIIFVDILGAKWQCYRSTQQTCDQLKSVGFKNIEILYDNAKIFPTITAFKIL